MQQQQSAVRHAWIDTDTEPAGAVGLWKMVRRFWCRHFDTVVIPRTLDMPPHVVCQSCGWREPVMPSAPIGTRTWDSTRDEYRYAREKKRRRVIEEQKQDASAQLAGPMPSPIAPRRRRANILRMKRLG